MINTWGRIFLEVFLGYFGIRKLLRIQEQERGGKWDGGGTLTGQRHGKGHGFPETASSQSRIWRRASLFLGLIFACMDGKLNSPGVWQLTRDHQRTLGSDGPGHMWLCSSLDLSPGEDYLTFQSPHLQSTGNNNSYLLKCLWSSREIRAGETVHQKCFPAPHNLTVWLRWTVFTLTAPSKERDLFNGWCGQNWKQEMETLTSCIPCFSKVGDSQSSWEIWLETEVALVIPHGS